MNRLNVNKRTQVVAVLCEGNSVRSTARMTGVAKNTVVKLLVELGEACSEYMDKTLRNLPCKRLQVDEIWSFCYAKQKNVTMEMLEQRYAGDVWTFVAIEAQTKLVVSWLAGQRDAGCATEFLKDVESRLAGRVQLTTDGHKMYLTAVADAFPGEIDYAQLVKIYGNDPEGQRTHSPATCLGCEKIGVAGNPDPKHISTSFVERQSLRMRMQIRRYTRLTNAFSKKLDNHVATVALYFMWYNFGRKHQMLGTTPAVASGVADHVWSVAEIVALLDSNRPTTVA